MRGPSALDLDPKEICRISAAAGVDHRTTERFLRGEVAQRNSRARARLVHAMWALGYGALIPHPGPAKARERDR